jgi:hypothetical protein
MRNRTILLAAVATLLVASAVLLRHAAVDSPQEPKSTPAPTLARSRAQLPQRVPQLAVVETAKPEDRDRAHQEAYSALVAALRSDPEATLAELEAFLADADPTKLSTQIAIGALVAVGTPEMQRALVRLVDARATDEAFARGAIPVIGFLLQPTVETENALRGFARDGQSEAMQMTSHLALGTMASRLASRDPQRASAIVDDYATRLASAQTVDERRRWLMVLGNSRTENASAAIETQLGDPDPAIRRSAVEAMRLAPAADAERKLSSALADGDAAVRASAAWSLSHRQPASSTIDAMLARLAVEQDDSVVSALLNTLWARRDDRVISAVRQLAHGSPSTTIRERAQRLLDTV